MCGELRSVPRATVGVRSLTSSSSFREARGTADGNPALRLVAAIVCSPPGRRGAVARQWWQQEVRGRRRELRSDRKGDKMECDKRYERERRCGGSGWCRGGGMVLCGG